MKMLIKGNRRKGNRFLIWLPLLAALFIFSNIGEAQAFDGNIKWPDVTGIDDATGGNGEVTVLWYQASNSATSQPNWYDLGHNIYCSPTSEVSPFDFGGSYTAETLDPELGYLHKYWSHTIYHFHDSSGNEIPIKNNRTYYLGIRAYVTDTNNPDPNTGQKFVYMPNTITLTLTDPDSPNPQTYTNSQTVDVEVLGEDADIVAWLISETQDTQPAINNPEWGAEPTTSYTFDTATEELKTVYIWVKDNDDSINGPWIYATITLDTSSPLLPDISSSTHSDENTWYFNNDPSFVWTTPQDSSGIAGYSYILDQIAETIPDTVVDTPGNSASYTDVVDSIWYFHVRAKDGAGNWGVPDHYQVRIDTTPPPVPTLLLPLNDSATKESTPIFDWSDVIDGGSGLANYEIEVDNNPDYSSAEYSATPTASTATPGTDLDDDTYYWHVRAKDNVGNESNWTGSWTVRTDTELPFVVTITVTPNPAPALLPGALEFKLIFNESMDTSVAPTVSYDPEGATGPQPVSTVVGPDWSTTNPANPNDTYTVYNDNGIDKTTGDGIATISVTGAQDSAENVMEPDTDDTFIINLPITIQNQGASPLSFNPLEPPLPLEGEVTTISYVLSESAIDVDITIIDQGTNLVVRNLVTDMPKDGGLNIVDWDGKNDAGNFVIIPGEVKQYDALISAQGSLLPGDFDDKTIQKIKADSTLPVIKIISDDDPILRYAITPQNAATIIYETNAPGDNTPLNVTIRIRDSYGDVTPYTFNNYPEGIYNWLWDATAFPEGLYQYEILAKTLPPKPLSANSKKGIIVILDENNIEWSSADGNVKINSPATGPTIDITPLAPGDEPTEATQAILTADPSQYLQSFMYDIIADPPTDFVPPAIMTFSYDPALVGEVKNKLQIRYFDTVTNSWVLVERQYIDIANHWIVAEIDHLSLFALFTCDDTTPPVVTITSPEAKEYYHTTDGEPTIIDIIYTAQDPVAEGISTGVVKEIVLLNGEEYEYETIDLSILAGENTLTVKAIDKAGNIGWSKVKFTVVLVARVTIKPEALKVTPGILTAFVEFPEGHNVAYIVDATCDGAAYESMMLNEDGTVMIIKFRRDAIEEALSLLEPPQSIDTAFKVRGTLQDEYGSYIFEATDTIMKVLEGSAPPGKGKGKSQ